MSLNRDIMRHVDNHDSPIDYVQMDGLVSNKVRLILYKTSRNTLILEILL